mgnify:CR=1 FL=1
MYFCKAAFYKNRKNAKYDFIKWSIMNELYPCVILLIISILFLRSMEKVVPWVST